VKVRNGFVSNSSSSSFTIICKEVTLDEAPDFALNNWYSPCSEGEDLIELNNEMIEYLKKAPYEDTRGFHYYVEFSRHENGRVIKRDSLPEEFTIISDEFDYHNSVTLSDLISRYRLGEKDD
jgi:hypothetical protein